MQVDYDYVMDEGLSQVPEKPTHADTDSGTENDSA